MSQFSAFLDKTFSNQNKKKKSSVSFQIFSEEKPPKLCCILKAELSHLHNCLWLLPRDFPNIHIPSINLFQCHHFFSPLAQPGEVTNKVFHYATYYLKCISQQAGGEWSSSVSFFYSIIFAWEVPGSFPGSHKLTARGRADTQVQHTTSIFTVPFFHASVALTFQWAQFCFVRLLSIMPDPNRQSLNSAELQPFPKIHCQVSPLNSHTVWHSQQLPHPSQLPFEVWGFCNLLFHKRQLLHLAF